MMKRWLPRPPWCWRGLCDGARPAGAAGRRAGGSSGRRVCPAAGAKKANLGFTVNDMNGKAGEPLRLQGQGRPARLLGHVVRPLQGRDPDFIELQQDTGRRGSPCSACRSTTPSTS